MTTRRTQSELGIARDGPVIAIGPASAHRLINVATVATLVLLVAGIGEPEPLMYALWVVIAIGAFVFGVRQTVVRLVIVTLLIAGAMVVASATGRAEEVSLLEVTEWPLMIGITLIVAMLAARVKTLAGSYAALYRDASDRLITAQEDERGHLARDLHDGVGQTLSATIFTLDVADSALRPGASSADVERAREQVRRAMGLAAAALDDVRDVAEQLRPPRLAEMGLGAAFRELAESAGIPVEVKVVPSVLPPALLAPEREIDVYRVVQEALANAARHGRANHVWIDAARTSGGVRIEVGDDGIGFDPSAAQRGMGLASMRDRAGILGGEVHVRSHPGETLVTLTFPTLDPPGTTDSVGHVAEAIAT